MDRRLPRVAMVLLGACGLLAKRHYTGAFEALVHSYLGNVAGAFAVYFVLASPPALGRRPAWVAAALALVVVQGFELADGFGLMQNTYDPWDLLANTFGVAVAWGVDRYVLTGSRFTPPHPRPAR